MILTITAQSRRSICDRIMEAPEGYTVSLKEPARNLEQNSKLWAMLGEVSEQVEWHGVKLTAENWKDIFTASLKRSKVVPGLDGGFVVLGQHTSRMSKTDFSELLELIAAFGADHDVKFSEQETA